MIRIEIPGAPTIQLEHLILDVNGTLTLEGELLDGVEPRIKALKELVAVQLASADSFGTLAQVAARLGVASVSAPDAASKLHLVEQRGAARTAHVGNGANDVPALQSAALGIAICGTEGLSGAALFAADLVYVSINDALDALLDPRRLTATLRS